MYNLQAKEFPVVNRCRPACLIACEKLCAQIEYLVCRLSIPNRTDIRRKKERRFCLERNSICLPHKLVQKTSHFPVLSASKQTCNGILRIAWTCSYIAHNPHIIVPSVAKKFYYVLHMLKHQSPCRNFFLRDTEDTSIYLLFSVNINSTALFGNVDICLAARDTFINKKI